MKYKHSKEKLEDVVKNCLSIADVCRTLEIIPSGGNYKTLHHKFKIFNINIDHFTGQGWNTGNRYRAVKEKSPLCNILIEDSSYSSSSCLRKRLINENIKIHKCEKCFNTDWLGIPISLELNHINGVNNDHRIENLELLCPNCHAQTTNYRGKNMKSFRDKQ